jgi:hypothetical protein
VLPTESVLIKGRDVLLIVILHVTPWLYRATGSKQERHMFLHEKRGKVSARRKLCFAW